MSTYTSPEQVATAYSTLQQTFNSGKTKSLAWRKWQLKQVWWMVADNEEAIARALHSDLNRHDLESYSLDIRGVKTDILDHIKNLEAWAADDIPDAGFLFGTFCGARVRKEPLGIALILGTWNFPFILTLSPMVAAIAAGCAVLVKPSEIAMASQHLMAEILPKYLDPEAIRIVTGGPTETGLILQRRFDSIFYTGSAKIAKFVSAAAAKHLTPTTLELGGQAPCIVTRSADIDTAAKRITFSKFLNAGQMCVAANHVFVDPSVHDKFVERATYWLGQFLKSDGEDQETCIVNERNYDRLIGLLDRSGGNVVHRGEKSRENKCMQPTLFTGVNMQDSLMSEEIFGPILPIMKMDYRQACSLTSKGEHPLGLYIFSTNQAEIDEILSKTNSGGVTINDTMTHAGVPNAPFGGVGNSGSGAYHGRYGFDTFTHRRTVVYIPGWMDYVLGFRYPPYDKKDISKVTVNNPGFKRGEGMEHQVIDGGGMRMGRLVRTMGRWALFAVGLAVVDARMGGRPRFLEVLGGLVNGLRSRLPM